jgi:dipeptidyl-peptidase-4
MKRILLILIAISFSFTSFSQNTYKEITVADLWKTWTFWAPSVSGLSSMNDGEQYTTLSRKGELEKFSYNTGDKVETIVRAEDLKIEIDDYEFNADETKLLLQTNYESIYRRSFTAEYYIYEINTKKLTKLSEKGKQQVATFSPDGTKIAFVRENNIFIKNLADNSEIQITTDGEYNKIINGIPDWVYEEEFEFNKAYTWSPDSKNLAYIKFDESNVKMFGMTVFAGQEPKIEENVLYPEYRTWKYPKCGEDNSIMSVHIYNFDSKKTLKADIGTETDIYIPRVRWTEDNNLLGIFRLNRLQNKFELLTSDITSGKTNVIYTETNKYYFDETDFDNIEFLEGGKYFCMTSERNGYRHIYLHDMSGKQIAQLTTGKFDVTDFYGFDSKNNIFYYQAAAVNPMQREIYSVDIKGKKTTKLTTKAGTNDADFSKSYKYFINYFSSTETPVYVTLNDKTGKLIRVLKDNSALRKKIDEYGGINKNFFTFKTSEGIELNAWIITPPNFDHSKQYSAIITQYSGPGSQEVLDSWSFGWDNLLAQKGAIVICVDSRGTGARGEEFKKMTYKELGKYETIDLIETAKYLQTLPYINKDKIGIWGWSYGGFMTSLCMTKGADYFNTGIAVAPVTNWRYYDNIYTERFMRTPQENPTGYDENSPINFADKLKGNFLIVHGTADDNVHWQNTAEFTEALVQADKQFSEFIYTNRNHGIYGGNTRMHLFTMMLNFWEKNLLN